VREYELTIIIQPEISEEGSAAILERGDQIMAAEGAIRLLCEDLGKRKLAYEIRKFQKGHYYLLSFLDEGTAVPAMERALRLEESVLRFLTVKVNDRVLDIEARKAEAKEKELELQKRAAEKSAREAEEAKARAEAEAEREAEAARTAEKGAAEAAEAAEAAAAEGETEAAPESTDEQPAAEPAAEASDESADEGERS
jgi:small subunit ribosomal protein S6